MCLVYLAAPYASWDASTKVRKVIPLTVVSARRHLKTRRQRSANSSSYHCWAFLTKFLPPIYPSQLRSSTFPPVLFLLEWHLSDTREPSAANGFSGDSEFHCRGGNMGPLARLPLFSCSTCRFTGQVWFIWRINARGLVLRFILVKHPTVGWSASTKNQHSTSPSSTSISFSLSSDVPCSSATKCSSQRV